MRKIMLILDLKVQGTPCFLSKKFFDRLEEEKMKKHKRLSIEELRNFTGFENYTDEEAEATIKTLETLSILYYELFMKEKLNEHSLTIKDQNYETDQRTAA